MLPRLRSGLWACDVKGVYPRRCAACGSRSAVRLGPAASCGHVIAWAVACRRRPQRCFRRFFRGGSGGSISVATTASRLGLSGWVPPTWKRSLPCRVLRGRGRAATPGARRLGKRSIRPVC